MKTAVIETGGKQYIVRKDDIIEVEKLAEDKSVSFEPLLVYDDKEIAVGQPTVKGGKVTAKVVEQTRGDKVTSIRFKAKKRVNKKRGHRQSYTKLQITEIK